MCLSLREREMEKTKKMCLQIFLTGDVPFGSLNNWSQNIGYQKWETFERKLYHKIVLTYKSSIKIYYNQ